MSRVDVELLANAELGTLLRHMEVGATFSPAARSQAAELLEYLIPALLVPNYPRWRWGGLDGVFPILCRKDGDTSLLALGTAILIACQRMTPFAVKLEVSYSSQQLAGWAVCIGERGDGELGISGPAYGSTRAFILSYELAKRVEDASVAWVYRAGGGSLADDPILSARDEEEG